MGWAGGTQFFDGPLDLMLEYVPEDKRKEVEAQFGELEAAPGDETADGAVAEGAAADGAAEDGAELAAAPQGEAAENETAGTQVEDAAITTDDGAADQATDKPSNT